MCYGKMYNYCGSNAHTEGLYTFVLHIQQNLRLSIDIKGDLLLLDGSRVKKQCDRACMVISGFQDPP